MPSPATITASSIYVAAAKETITSARWNTNLSFYRGHIIPIDPTTVASASNSYDLGSTDHKWRSGYFGTDVKTDTINEGTTGTGVTVDGVLIKDGNVDGVDVSALLPTGVILPYSGTSAPAGYLMCDGSAFNRTTYAALFTAIGTTWGVGDNSTTANLPDTRGLYLKGAGTTNRAAGVDASGNYYAATLGTYVQDKMQGHYHAAGPALYKYLGSGGSFSVSVSGGTNDTNATVTNPTTDGTNGTPRTGHTTEPQNAGVYFIIKY